MELHMTVKIRTSLIKQQQAEVTTRKESSCSQNRLHLSLTYLGIFTAVPLG